MFLPRYFLAFLAVFLAVFLAAVFFATFFLAGIRASLLVAHSHPRWTVERTS
jgi:hypothetical protein